MTVDMFVDPADDPRVEGPTTGDERAMLLGMLRWYRDTLVLKCSGLDAAQLAARAVEPSSMSLLGIVRHLAEVERNWFRRTMAGQTDAEAPPIFYSRDDDLDGDWDNAVADDACVDEAWATWREEVAWAERFVEDAPSLEVIGVNRYGEHSLRWVLLHMIEEYARHVGHADLLRERLDGAVGQ